MITNEAEFMVAVTQLARANRALESLRETVLTKNPGNFTVLAESYIETRDTVFTDLDDYLRTHEPALRNQLVHRALLNFPRVSGQAAARMAGVFHLIEATHARSIPNGADSLFGMLLEVLETATHPTFQPESA